MGTVIKTTLAGVLSVALTAPTFADPIESLVDEIRRDLIIHMPQDPLHHYLVNS